MEENYSWQRKSNVIKRKAEEIEEESLKKKKQMRRDTDKSWFTYWRYCELGSLVENIIILPCY